MFPRLPAWHALGVLALSGLLAAGCGGGGEGPADGAFPDAPVILISIDTLRSDRLPAYGYDAITTPAIDRLRRDGILYEHAYSSYPLTLPAHVTMLSGLLPTEHGVRDNVGYRFDAAAHDDYLPRTLRQRGFATGAAVSTWLLGNDTGLGDGFDFYEDGITLRSGTSLGESQRNGGVTVDRALAWLQEQRGKYFLFVHLYEPHTPYQPPEPFRSRAAHPYDGEIMAADALVGRLLDALAARGDYDRATIVLLSDHGEGLGEHGEREHGILLYRETLQVPLILKLPGNRHAGETVTAPAHLADVAPTLAALAGAPQPERTTLLDLRAADAPPRDLYAESYYARLHLGWSELTSLIRGDLHYIEGPDPELYDLAADPAELHNVLTERRREYASLRDALAPLRRDLAAPSEVDAETAKRLAALGYLSTPAAAGDGSLPDPKGKIHVLADLDRANRLARDKRLSEAVDAFRGVVADNPGMTDAWEGLALVLGQAGRFDEAVAAFEKAMELTRGADRVALGLARLYLDAGKHAEARQHAELALTSNPAAAHQVLAEVALREEDLTAAESHARACLETRPSHIPALLLLTQVAIQQDRLDEAQTAFARAEREQAGRDDSEPPVGMYLVKGDLLARLGQDGPAVESLEREIALHPGEPRAYSRLALVHALAGRPQQAVATLRRLVEGNENPVAYAAAVETLRVLGDPVSAGRLLQSARARFPGDPRLEALAAQG